MTNHTTGRPSHTHDRVHAFAWQSGYEFGRTDGRRDAARSLGRLLDRDPEPSIEDILSAVLDYSQHYCDRSERN